MRADELIHFPFLKKTVVEGVLQYMTIIILYCALRTVRHCATYETEET